MLAWFLPWYLMRYVHLPWPVTDEIKVLGLGIASALLYCIWDWARTQKRRPRPADNLLPFDRSRRLAGDIVNHAVDP